MNNNILISWITLTGICDYLDERKTERKNSPDYQGLWNLLHDKSIIFKTVIFFYQPKKYGQYIEQFQSTINSLHKDITFNFISIEFPNVEKDKHNFNVIYNVLKNKLKNYINIKGNLYYFFNAGTIEMRLTWFLLSQSSVPGIIVKSDVNGIGNVTVPDDFKKQVFKDFFALLEDTSLNTGIQEKSIDLQLNKVALFPFPIMLSGETGVGKTYTAELIHKKSERKGKFISLNCGAIPQELIESELFGIGSNVATGVNKSNGAFRDAHEGTLFLDEIAELPILQQQKLLKAIGEKKITPMGSTTAIDVDLLIITGTNRNIGELVTKGLFRQDLYFRLNITEITLPPLRDEKERIIPLAHVILNDINNHLKSRFLTKNEYTPKKIHPDSESILINHYWKGNIRELENVLKRTIINMNLEEENIKPEHLIFTNTIPSSLDNNILIANTLINNMKENNLPLSYYLNEIKNNIIKICLDNKMTQNDIGTLLKMDQSTVNKQINKRN